MLKKSDISRRDYMPLSDKETKLLIKKLRDKFDEYGKKFSKAWFSSEAFEERLNMAISKKMNLEGFILAEIANFEKTKDKYDKKKSQKPFSALVDNIIEENRARIKKYDPVYFHPLADLEIVHFYGALSDFAEHQFPIIYVLVKDSTLKNRINQYNDKLNFLAIPVGKKHSKRILDHILILNRPAGSERDRDSEKDKNLYLRESAFVLHDIINFCDDLLNLRSSEWETPIRFDKIFIEGEKKKRVIQIFSGFTGYGAILKIKESAESIIQDFRLGAFKGKSPSSF
jgi:hypothetical protein